MMRIRVIDRKLELDMDQNNDHDNPMKKLAAAMIFRAVQDALGIFESFDYTCNRKSRAQRAAVNWLVNNPAFEYQIPFNLCCEVLEIDSKSIIKFALNPDNKKKIFNTSFRMRVPSV